MGPSGCPHPAPGGGQSYPLRRQQTNSFRPFYPMQSCVVGGSNSVKRLGINRNSISIYLIFGNAPLIVFIQNNLFTCIYFIYCRSSMHKQFYFKISSCCVQVRLSVLFCLNENLCFKLDMSVYIQMYVTLKF